MSLLYPRGSGRPSGKAIISAWTHAHPESTTLTSRSRAHCEYHMLLLFVSFQGNQGKHRHSIFIPNSVSIISSTDVDSVGEKEQLDTYSDSPR